MDNSLNMRSDETELQELSISSALECLLQGLEPRQAKIVKLRYGLENGERQTLEQIGQELEVSRERVRQIQSTALRRLQHPSKRKYLQVISSLLENVFSEAGGVLRESEIPYRLMETTPLNNFHPDGVSRFVLQLSSKFVEVGDEVWALAEYPLKCMPTVSRNAVKLVERHRTRVRFNTVVTEIKNQLSVSEAATVLDSAFIEACIKASPDIEVSSDGWCVLPKWRTSYLDEVIQVLRDEGKPLHYRVIAKRTNDLISDKQVTEHGVHAFLQREKTIFIRTDPGTYGLVEWEIKAVPYYLRLIEDTLLQAGKPLTAREVTRHVLDVRPCKESTVLMYLTWNERFVKLESGRFALREWLAERQQNQSEGLDRPTDPFIEQLKKEAMAELKPFSNSISSTKQENVTDVPS